MNDIRETALKYAVAFCGYEYEMPYVHEEQVVWADAPETVWMPLIIMIWKNWKA